MITINNQDRRPIYLQLIANIEELVAKGLLAAGEQLPSVRTLALQLTINPNTIARAYQELERRGVTYSIPGKGSFIAKTDNQLKERMRQELFLRLNTLIHEAIELDIPAEQFAAECHSLAASAYKEGAHNA